MRKAIKLLDLKITDLLLAIWFSLGIVLFIESYRLSRDSSLLSTILPTWTIVIFFIILIILFVFYIIMEKRRDSNKIRTIFLAIFLYILISQFITIFLQPTTITYLITDINNDTNLVTTYTSFSTKITHFAALMFVLLSLYIGFFYLTKRIRYVGTFIWGIRIVFIFALFVFIYSLFKDNYFDFISLFFSDKFFNTNIYDFAPGSIFNNKNQYGIFDEICIILSIFYYYLTKRKYSIVLSFVFFIHLVTTLCKTGIIITGFVLLVYLITLFVIGIKKKEKGTLLLSGITLLIITITAVAIILLFFLNEDAHRYIVYLDYHHTLTERLAIWFNSYQLTSKASFVYGSGYGIYDTILYNCPLYYTDAGMAYTHNWFLLIIGTGGVIMLFPYVIFLVAFAFLLKKAMKNDYKIGLVFVVASSIFFLHSFLEDNCIHLMCCYMLIKAYLNANDNRVSNTNNE